MKKKEKRLNNNNGITLIALVVTIIVLIILAGVSISLVLGDNGIITKAKKGKENTELAKIEEEVQLNETVEYLENFNKKPGESGYQGGNYDDPYVPVDFTHTEGTWNNGYTIKDGLGNEFVWVPCVTDVSKIKSGDSVELFKKTTEDKYNVWSFRLSPTDTNVADEEPTEAIRKSVEKYEGFYIAKYEAGVPVDKDGNEIGVDVATVSQKTRSVSGAKVWTDLSRTDAITVASNMIDSSITGVKSGLISAECWDTTLQWMVNTSDNEKNEPNLGYDVDSTGKGWYKDVSNGGKTTTGKYVVNNIYDMGGNLWEWTLENSINDEGASQIIRGGVYGCEGSEFPAAHRHNAYNQKHGNVGFRVILYK